MLLKPYRSIVINQPKYNNIIKELPRYHRNVKVYAITKYKDEDSSEDEEKSRFKKEVNNRTDIFKELNRIFYMDYSFTGTELKDLIIGTFKRPYNVKLEVRESNIYLIIYPSIQYDEELYIDELNKIALVLTEWNLKRILIDEFKNLKIKSQDRIEILLKVEYRS